MTDSLPLLHRLAPLVAAGALCVAGPGLGAEDDPPTGSQGNLELHQRLADEFGEVDPDASGWESESLTEEVTARMKKLAKLLIHPEEISAKKIAPYLGEDFKSGPLRYKNLESLSESVTMTVSAPAAGTEEGAKPASLDADGFTSALKSLGSFLDDAKYRRAKFKVMHAEIKAGHALTKMLFELR